MQEQQKQAAAKAAINYIKPYLQPTAVIGVGTGSTTNYFIDALQPLKHTFAAAVASSEDTAKRLAEQGIKVMDLNQVDTIEYYVDGTDEANPQLNLIKGGGAALTREKIIASVATTFVCIADASKWVTTLGTFPLPVEVIPMARNHVSQCLQDLGGEPIWRQGIKTDNGNHIIDVHGLAITHPAALEQAINQIAGVVTHGIFAQRGADLLLLATPQGVQQISPVRA